MAVIGGRHATFLPPIREHCVTLTEERTASPLPPPPHPPGKQPKNNASKKVIYIVSGCRYLSNVSNLRFQIVELLLGLSKNPLEVEVDGYRHLLRLSSELKQTLICFEGASIHENNCKTNPKTQ